MGAPLVIASGPGVAALSLWNGSGNDAPPAGWNAYTHENTWAGAAVADTGEGVACPGSTAIWPSSPPPSLHDEAIFRHGFFLPAGIKSITMQMDYDDELLGVWINGVPLETGAAPYLPRQNFGLVLDGFRPNDTNVLAVWARNNSAPGPGNWAFISYVLYVDATGLVGGAALSPPAEAGSGAGLPVAGGPGGGAANQVVRVRHGSGVICWETDGHTFRVLSDDKGVLQTPFPLATRTPDHVLGHDPPTGLPMWWPFNPADYATQTDIADRPRMDHTDQLGKVAQWGTRPDDPIALPDPVVDKCPIMRCGAAYYLGQKLKEQYDLIRGLLLWMLAAPLLLGGSGTAFEVLLAKLVDWLVQKEVSGWLVAVIRYLLRRVKATGLGFASSDLEDLGAGGATTLQRLAYGVLTCTNNTFDLTPDMLIAWQQAIMNDTVDFTEWQRNLLVYCVQLTPFATYHQLAATGAEKTSDTCGGFGP